MQDLLTLTKQNGGYDVIAIDLATVPEPGSVVLLLTAIAGILLLRRQTRLRLVARR